MPSTLTRAPKILILSVSIADLSACSMRLALTASSQVLAIRILAFSIRLGELVAMVLSRMKPGGDQLGPTI